MILKIKIFWACLKKNWKAAALFLWSAAVWIISRRNSSAAIEAMQANKESYEAQIKVLKDRVNRKRYINDYYKKKLAHIPFISFLEERKFCKSNFWLTTIVLSTESTIDKEKFRLFMEKNNIEVRPLWKPMHLQPIYKESPSYINGVSEDLFNRGLCLPSGTNMKIDDLERVIKCINQLYEI